MTPIAIALAGAIWPPVARGDVAFPAIVWLGILALLCLVPSITGVVNQLLAFGSRTLLPSLEAAYPWLLALFATSLFSGFGIARRLQGGTAMRRRRLIAGTAIAAGADAALGRRLRGRRGGQRRRAARPAGRRRRASGRPTGADQPPACDAAADGRAVGAAQPPHELPPSTSARSGRSMLTGVRVGRDFRWLAYVATSRQLGQFGAARIGDQAWTIAPGTRWRAGRSRDGRRRHASTSRRSRSRSPRTIGRRPRIAASRSSRARGPDAVGSRSTARSSRRRSRRSRWLVGGADLHRWRGQLDYWVFLDGQLGQVAGSINGEAAEIVPDALNGTIEVRLTATERGRDSFIYPPTPMTLDDDRGRYATKRDRLARLARLVSILQAHPEGMRTGRHRDPRRDVRADRLPRPDRAPGRAPAARSGARTGVWGIDDEKAFLPPLKLTQGEAMAVVLSARLMVRYADKYDPDLAAAFEKLERGLPLAAGRARRAHARRPVQGAARRAFQRATSGC